MATSETSSAKFGHASLAFDGTGDYISVVDPAHIPAMAEQLHQQGVVILDGWRKVGGNGRWLTRDEIEAMLRANARPESEAD